MVRNNMYSTVDFLESLERSSCKFANNFLNRFPGRFAGRFEVMSIGRFIGRFVGRKFRNRALPGTAEKGFTLVELVAALVVVGLLFSAVGAAYAVSQRAVVNAVASGDLEQYALFAVSYIEREVRLSRRLLYVQPRELALVNQSGNKIIFRLQGDTLYRVFYNRESDSFPLTSNPVTSYVSELRFENTGSNNVRIYLSLTANGVQYGLATECWLRVEG